MNVSRPLRKHSFSRLCPEPWLRRCFDFNLEQLVVMLTHSSLSLPLEIVGIIVQEIQAHSPSLKACFMVCRSFHAVSRPLLFSRVELAALAYPLHNERGREPARNTCSTFYQLLQEFPDIAKLVRHLFVTDDCPKENLVGPGRRATGWVIRETTLPLVLHKLSNVNLRSFGFYGGGWPWGTLSKFLKSPLQAVFKAPQLTSIAFTGVTGLSQIPTLMTLFEECTSLKHLMIDEVDFVSSRGGTVNATRKRKSSHPCRQLEFLHFDAHHLPSFMKWLDTPSSTVSISQLRTLSMRSIYPDSHSAIQTLFATTYHSLEHLNIYRTSSKFVPFS